MTDVRNGFPGDDNIGEFARSAYEYDCWVTLIEGEGEERRFTSRFEDETGRLHEVSFSTDFVEEGQRDLLAEGAPFKMKLVPEEYSGGSIPVAKHKVILEFQPVEPVTQEDVAIALAVARARRARRVEGRPF